MVSERYLAQSTHHFDTETQIHDSPLSGTERRLGCLYFPFLFQQFLLNVSYLHPVQLTDFCIITFQIDIS